MRFLSLSSAESSCKHLPGAVPLRGYKPEQGPELNSAWCHISDSQATTKFSTTENSSIFLSCVAAAVESWELQNKQAGAEVAFPNNFLDILQLLPLRKLIQSLQLQHQQFLWRGKLSKNIKSTFLQHTQTHSWLPNNGFFFGPNLSLQRGEKEWTGQVMPNLLGFFWFVWKQQGTNHKWKTRLGNESGRGKGTQSKSPQSFWGEGFPSQHI